jgi:hypothetical protein
MGRRTNQLGRPPQGQGHVDMCMASQEQPADNGTCSINGQVLLGGRLAHKRTLGVFVSRLIHEFVAPQEARAELEAAAGAQPQGR